MLLDEHTRRVLALLADLLDYPRADYIELSRECETSLAKMPRRVETPHRGGSPGAAAHLADFRASVERIPAGNLEEIYTAAFDLGASSHLYVGAHLFGESYKRSVFLLWLKDCYRAHGFDSAAELPDHLPVLLRFLSVCNDAALADELTEDALRPVLGKLVNGAENDKGDDDADHRPSANAGAYGHVLKALSLVLEGAAKESPLPLGGDPGECRALGDNRE